VPVTTSNTPAVAQKRRRRLSLECLIEGNQAKKRREDEPEVGTMIPDVQAQRKRRHSCPDDREPAKKFRPYYYVR
jgi:hypothetical protein